MPNKSEQCVNFSAIVIQKILFLSDVEAMVGSSNLLKNCELTVEHFCVSSV